MLIADFFLESWDICIHPVLFSKSLIFRQVSDVSNISTGRYFFLYISLIGYSKDGPCLKFTLLFFSDSIFLFSLADEWKFKNIIEKNKIITVK